MNTCGRFCVNRARLLTLAVLLLALLAPSGVIAANRMAPGEGDASTLFLPMLPGPQADPTLFVTTSGACIVNPPLQVVLAGGPTPDTGISVDDDLTVYVNGVRVFVDADGHDNSQYGYGRLPPISLTVRNGDRLRVTAVDTVGGCRDLSPLYLHGLDDGALQFLDAGFPRQCGTAPNEVFYDKKLMVDLRGSVTSGLALVDQQQVQRGLANDLAFYSPVGQEFTPLLPGLDAVELYVLGWMQEPGPMLQVQIRETTITGRIVGVSRPYVPQGYTDPLGVHFASFVRFDFSTVVYLTPGKRYVAELVDISGQSYPAVLVNFQSRGETDPDYPGGARIMAGVPDPGGDLAFREGFLSPVPRSKRYCGNGLWQYLTRCNGGKFKSAEDCIHYITTGQ